MNFVNRSTPGRIGHREPVPTWDGFKNYNYNGIISLLESFGKFGLESNLFQTLHAKVLVSVAATVLPGACYVAAMEHSKRHSSEALFLH